MVDGAMKQTRKKTRCFPTNKPRHNQAIMLLGPETAVHWLERDPAPPNKACRASRVYYRGCTCGGRRLRVGDFVLICDLDAGDADTEDGCEVAEILHMYDTGDPDDAEPEYVTVQWYVRPAALPGHVRRKLRLPAGAPPLCNRRELLLDSRPFSADIPLSTVRAPCQVRFLSEADEPASVSTDEAEYVVRFCYQERPLALAPVQQVRAAAVAAAADGPLKQLQTAHSRSPGPGRCSIGGKENEEDLSRSGRRRKIVSYREVAAGKESLLKEQRSLGSFFSSPDKTRLVIRRITQEKVEEERDSDSGSDFEPRKAGKHKRKSSAVSTARTSGSTPHTHESKSPKSSSTTDKSRTARRSRTAGSGGGRASVQRTPRGTAGSAAEDSPAAPGRSVFGRRSLCRRPSLSPVPEHSELTGRPSPAPARRLFPAQARTASKRRRLRLHISDDEKDSEEGYDRNASVKVEGEGRRLRLCLYLSDEESDTEGKWEERTPSRRKGRNNVTEQAEDRTSAGRKGRESDSETEEAEERRAPSRRKRRSNVSEKAENRTSAGRKGRESDSETEKAEERRAPSRRKRRDAVSVEEREDVKRTPARRRKESDSECEPAEKSRASRSATASPRTPKATRTPRTPRSAVQSPRTPQSAVRSPRTPRSAVRSPRTPGTPGTPLVPGRQSGCLSTPGTPLQRARARLHVAAVPEALPCREHQFLDIYTFVEARLLDGTGGCMYVSGVPGTGKTATVREVVRSLQEAVEAGDLPAFQFVEVNGMRLTEPHRAYSHILSELSGNKAPPAQAARMLDTRFAAPAGRRQPTLLMVDELDLLWTRKQDVLYNLFEWPSRRHARLVVVAIANTMDLPERVMMQRVSSRLGLTRITFQPYSFQQLQTIVSSRISGLDAFHPDAIQLVSRKVAAVSGDARRALDICRRATELAEVANPARPHAGTPRKTAVGGLVLMKHVNAAIQEMFSSPKIMAIRACPEQGRSLLRAVIAEFQRTGLEEARLGPVQQQIEAFARFEGMTPPSLSDTLAVLYQLCASRLTHAQPAWHDLETRIRLNCSVDDVSYALQELPSD